MWWRGLSGQLKQVTWVEQERIISFLPTPIPIPTLINVNTGLWEPTSVLSLSLSLRPYGDFLVSNFNPCEIFVTVYCREMKTCESYEKVLNIYGDGRKLKLQRNYLNMGLVWVLAFLGWLFVCCTFWFNILWGGTHSWPAAAASAILSSLITLVELSQLLL